MVIKMRTFLFVCFLVAVFVCLDTYSSNAQKENNTNSATAKPTPTPKSKSKKTRKRRTQRKSSETIIIEPPKVGLFSSSNVVYLPCDDGNYSSECINGNNQVVDISAYATHPDGDTVVYKYQVNSGKIIGTGGNVKWDLSGVPEGKYEISVSVDYGKGIVITQSKDIEVVKCKCKLTASLQKSIADSDKAVTEPSLTPTPNYKISVSPPKREGYEGTSNSKPYLNIQLSSTSTCPPCESEKVAAKEDNKKLLVDISSNGTDPDGDTLLYSYHIDVGKIIGKGANVTWDLSGVAEGTYLMTVEVDDGHGAVTTQVAEIKVLNCNCRQTQCSALSVSCDNCDFEIGENVTLTVKLSKSTPNAVYKRQISHERIIENHGSKIVVETKNLKGVFITATVELSGLPDGYPNKGSATTDIY